MLSLHGEWGIIGSGEPPHNGLLYGFKLVPEGTEAPKYNCVAQVSNANIENDFIDICVEICNIEEPIIEAHLAGGNFHLEKSIEGERVTNFVFAFRVPLPSTIAPGDFVLSLSLFLRSGAIIIRSVAIKLTRRKPLPSRVYLNYIPDIVQEKPMYSGAAIAAALKKMYTKDDTSSQKDIREMVDAVRDLSGYEPFQTWRIVLRRVLTSRAKNRQELPEFSSLDQWP